MLPDERPSHFAKRLGLDPRVVLDYNALAKDTPRPAGSYLQIPVSAAPSGALVGRYFSRAPGGVPSVFEVHAPVPDGFPYGQCTYYAASRRNVTWAGNAGWWFDAANGIRPEGHVAVAGALVVFHTGWFGHVAYVEKVNPDGSFVVSEMNYYGDGGGWGAAHPTPSSGASPGSSTEQPVGGPRGKGRRGVLVGWGGGGDYELAHTASSSPPRRFS